AKGWPTRTSPHGFSSRRALYRAISPTCTTNSASARGCNSCKKLPDNRTNKDVFGQIRDSLSARRLITSDRAGHHLAIACRSISALGWLRRDPISPSAPSSATPGMYRQGGEANVVPLEPSLCVGREAGAAESAETPYRWGRHSATGYASGYVDPYPRRC